MPSSHNPPTHPPTQTNKQLTATDNGPIAQYAGTEVAFYFEWLHYYTKLLVVPSLLGVALFAFQQFSGKPSHPPTHPPTHPFPSPQQRIRTASFSSTFSTTHPPTHPPTSPTGTQDSQWVPLFNIALALWGTVLLEGWKRQNATKVSHPPTHPPTFL